MPSNYSEEDKERDRREGYDRMMEKEKYGPLGRRVPMTDKGAELLAAIEHPDNLKKLEQFVREENLERLKRKLNEGRQ